MNNEFNSNTRTLIVSFVFALMVMIPLRFVELNSGVNSSSAVLGESISFSEPRLEAPYDSLELNSESCLNNEYVDRVISFLTDVEEKLSFELRRCK